MRRKSERECDLATCPRLAVLSIRDWELVARHFPLLRQRREGGFECVERAFEPAHGDGVLRRLGHREHRGSVVEEPLDREYHAIEVAVLLHVRAKGCGE